MPAEDRTATQTLQERARQKIERALQASQAPHPRVLWWDAEGHLQSVLREAMSALGASITVADGNPLTLRREALEEPQDRALWYVPEAKEGRDWFRDIREAGDDTEITCSIYDLSAELYGASPWQLLHQDTADANGSVAALLQDELTTQPLPSFQDLRTKLLTQGESRAEELLLREGWSNLDRDEGTVREIRRLLEEVQVVGLAADDDPEALTDKTRRWAVAGWLLRAGLPPEHLPDGSAYAQRSDFAYRRLKSVLRHPGSAAPESIFLKDTYWPEAIQEAGDPWEYAACPVDGALDEQLWARWFSAFDGENHEQCLRQARGRRNVLQETYGKESAWSRAWQQAADLAELARRYATWQDRIGETPAPLLYGDAEQGTWRIDRAVREIIVSGAPEEALPVGHPARSHLSGIRQSLVGEEYTRYLRRLGQEMERAAQERTLFSGDGLRHSHQFWNEHKEALATGNEAALFYLDALRLDLARELAGRLRDQGCEVRASLWMSALPSETEFGMGALLPGKPRLFEIKMDGGRLRARRNKRRLDTTYRKEILANEGWRVAASEEGDAWSSPRVAYFDDEFDKIGENDLEEIERHLAGRVDRLAALVTTQLERGDWSKAYVVTDHGFVLLPEGSHLEALDPPSEAQDVRRRRIAGDGLPEAETGVLLNDRRVPALEYLDTSVNLLVDPQQRYKKQGISDARYFHGGASPQECVLCFLEIERS